MIDRCRKLTVVLVASSALHLIACGALQPAIAGDLDFFGRSGNAIELDFGNLAGVPSGANFSGLSLSGFSGHTVRTSSELQQGSFASDGRLWVFPNPTRDTPTLGDTDPAARGFQGTLNGSLLIDGQPKKFSATVRPGYTGAGTGSVGQSLESLNDPANNRLFVAEQQHRLNYFGFVPQGGGSLVVDGVFGANTDEAVRTFQAAFVAGINTTQASVDGIVGPNTAGWLNAANAPTWEELIDPDPQVPGTFSVAGAIGDFDILPGRDPGTNARTGNTPQPERFGTSWAHELWRNGSAAAKTATSITQLMNAMSTFDGYGSSAAHSTHRVGMDIDMHTNSSTHNFGDGSTSRAEIEVISTAVAYIDAGASAGSDSGRIIRIITSNEDIYDGIRAARPGTALYLDPSSVHTHHLHLDVGSPTREAGVADTPGDFDFDDAVNGFDFLTWQHGVTASSLSSTELAAWQSNFGASPALTAQLASVPEPSTLVLLLCWIIPVARRRKQRSSGFVRNAPLAGVTVSPGACGWSCTWGLF
ncbi:peptidoglycan-binding domain-containing protein [Adhaeretor mobilis]|uniref:Peptidoglycan binding domain protein n=1 Tax=Adhaeretor mobilis TaxID=1930276 RepID=A0A517MQ78_9BACT|nr:peptidoglycan-binding domain-containing protein [Adhaeretor mobilis]QDS97022.1 Putative peptidoglycan binding domain protein [Adhaeretor mobilis]